MTIYNCFTFLLNELLNDFVSVSEIEVDRREELGNVEVSRG